MPKQTGAILMVLLASLALVAGLARLNGYGVSDFMIDRSLVAIGLAGYVFAYLEYRRNR